MEKLVETLKKKQLTIASCESLTGGLFAARMTEIPGVSAVMKGGIVSYWTEIKESVVGVSHKTVKEYGVVSEQTALQFPLREMPVLTPWKENRPDWYIHASLSVIRFILLKIR